MTPCKSGRRGFLRLAGAGLATLPLRGAFAQAPAAKTLALADVNRMDKAAFMAAFGDTVEFSPWAAEAAYAKRPFATVTALHETIFDGLRSAPREQQHAFFKRLSDIGENAVPFTAASTSEQAASGISSLNATDLARLHELNKAYRAKFDMSYTICVRRNTVANIFSDLEQRLSNTRDVELARAIHEEFLITRLRIAEQVSGEGMPKVYGDLSAHVLNAVVGKPANGVAVELYELWGERRHRVAQGATNADGRAILISGKPLPIGRYEMRFFLGDYFRKSGAAAGEKPFVDVVPMRMFISKPEDSYHVPLIGTPFSYTVHG